MARRVLCLALENPVTAALDDLLARSLPAGTATDGPRRVWLRAAGRPRAVTVTGVGARLVQLAHAVPAADGLVTGERALLSVELDAISTRMDLPVEVVAWGRTHVVLRAIGAPLVLRRRIVRDQALADALGVAAKPGVDLGAAA